MFVGAKVVDDAYVWMIFIWDSPIRSASFSAIPPVGSKEFVMGLHVRE